MTLSTGVEQTGVIMGVRKPDGSVTWISVTSRRVNDEAPGPPCEVLVSFTDITELDERQRAGAEGAGVRTAARSADRPAPTACCSRTAWSTRSPELHATRTVVAVLFVDLDDFKDLNDSYGHDAGDRALIAVGRLATGALRPGDTFARLSGDEFVALCPDCTLQQAEDVAARVAATIAAGTADEQHPRLTASIGIALSGDQPITATDLTAHEPTTRCTPPSSPAADCTRSTPATGRRRPRSLLRGRGRVTPTRSYSSYGSGARFGSDDAARPAARRSRRRAGPSRGRRGCGGWPGRE